MSCINSADNLPLIFHFAVMKSILLYLSLMQAPGEVTRNKTIIIILQALHSPIFFQNILYSRVRQGKAASAHLIALKMCIDIACKTNKHFAAYLIRFSLGTLRCFAFFAPLIQYAKFTGKT